MERKGLPPGVQNHGDARLGTHERWVVSIVEQGFARGIEQHFEHHSSIAHDKGIPFMGQCEDHMIIGRGQQFISPLFYPGFLFHASAIGAMPVATTVVLQFFFLAACLVAPVEVIARHSGMAVTEFLEHRTAIWIKFIYQTVAKQFLQIVDYGHGTLITTSKGEAKAARFFFWR